MHLSNKSGGTPTLLFQKHLSKSKYFIEQSHIHITNTITWTLGMS